MEKDQQSNSVEKWANDKDGSPKGNQELLNIWKIHNALKIEKLPAHQRSKHWLSYYVGEGAEKQALLLTADRSRHCKISVKEIWKSPSITQFHSNSSHFSLR